MDESVPLDAIDQLITGARWIDLERNVGVLLAEGYLSDVASTLGDPLWQVTVKLVREVERFGAAREDVVAERDYPAALRAYAVLSE